MDIVTDYKLNRVDEGICHIWSRDRHFSPSLPGNGYLKLDSQKRSPGHRVQRYCCCGILFAHTQAATNPCSYHNQKNICVG